LDHATKDYPQLLVKWQERGIQNQSSNQNIHKISEEIRDEGPKIATITCRGYKTSVDAANKGMHIEKWVRKSAGHMSTFDPQQEKETYQQIRNEIL
jgi:DNA-binding winged helix-turn-helix (wHTH) protein